MSEVKVSLAIQIANTYLQEYTREELYQLSFDYLVDSLINDHTEIQLLNKWNEINGPRHRE